MSEEEIELSKANQKIYKEQEENIYFIYDRFDIGIGDDLDMNKVEDQKEALRRAAGKLVERLCDSFECTQNELADILGCAPGTISRWKRQETQPLGHLSNLVALTRKAEQLGTRAQRRQYKHAMLFVTYQQENRQIKDPVTGQKFQIQVIPAAEYVRWGQMDSIIGFFKQGFRIGAEATSQVFSELAEERGVEPEEIDIPDEEFLALLNSVEEDIMSELFSLWKKKLKQKMKALLEEKE